MPLYELRLIARMGEAEHFSIFLRNLSSNIMQMGGVVRTIYNVGDRVLVKSLRSGDGKWYSIGRFLNMEVDASPALRDQIIREVKQSDEILKVYANKMKEDQYLDRIMKRLNAELSPFRDKSDFDEDYVRAMWTKYMQLDAIRQQTTPKKVEQDLPRIYEFVKKQRELQDEQYVGDLYKGDTFNDI